MPYVQVWLPICRECFDDIYGPKQRYLIFRPRIDEFCVICHKKVKGEP